MAEYHLLRETPEGSGNFVATGDKTETIDDAVAECEARSAKGGRFGIWIYEALRPAVAHQADQAEAQDMAVVQNAASEALVAPAPVAQPAAPEPAPTPPQAA